ncbi:hypothetical protein J5N97_029965 [Dioscorea zingiberensis]|uniref:Uncharacterized protein n=1 Tax=Dioscorea zingiberensis TaxID=325984 RepID=A0A9D5BWB0_9LILI|nr:hypothetical protein J5N97_029965 [Dioscorea zingiberensis]
MVLLASICNCICRFVDGIHTFSILWRWCFCCNKATVGMIKASSLKTLFIHTHADFVVLSLYKGSLLGEVTTKKRISCIQCCTHVQKEILVLLHS